MAYQGRKVVSAGEVFSASDMNSTIDQTVMVFAGTAARSSAVPTPTEGMVSYLADTDLLQYQGNSAWQSLGPTPYIEMVSGSYYRPQGNYAAATGLVAIQYFTLLYVPYQQTFDRIGMRTSSTAYSGTGVVRLGIYANGGGLPTTLIADYGTVSTTAANTSFEITIDQTLAAGFYWLAFDMQTAPTTGGHQGLSGVAASQNYQGLPSNLTFVGGAIVGYEQNDITGAFADITGAVTQVSRAPIPFLRAT